jgi:hypothetical protein
MKTQNKKQNKEMVETQTVSGIGKNLNSVVRDCEVDLNTWDVDHYTIDQNSRGYNYTLYLKKKTVDPKFKEELISEIKSLARPTAKAKRANFTPTTGKLVEANISDFHLGKLCWDKETGEDYDLKIAARIFEEAIAYNIETLKGVSGIEKIVFPVGNDFYHTDNHRNTTTAGTPQDADSRFQKMFQVGARLILDAINDLKEIAPVDVVVVAGNHGRASEEILGSVINAYFSKDKNVTIDDNFLPRKYYRYGNNLIGYLHGDGVKLPQLPILMATEAAEHWGKTKYRYVNMGHFHHTKVYIDEISGVITRIMPSLAGTDYWHKMKGYSGNIKSALSSIYDKQRGLVQTIHYNL